MKSDARGYVMRARLEAAEQRRADIITAAMRAFMSAPFDEVTLQLVADRAGVSQKTVARMFGSKEGLITACMEAGPRREEAVRAVAPGDIDAAVAILVDRYEAMVGSTLHGIALSERLPQIRQWLDLARKSHRDWLAHVFAPWLPARGAEREVRLLQLFGATELYTWWSWREPLGASKKTAEHALRANLRILVDHWKRTENT